MRTETLRIGTRASDLALWQANRVARLLSRAHPNLRFEIVEVSTWGDRDRQTPLRLSGGVGVFVKGLEYALLDEEIDLAVHSLKDMPSRVPPHLALGAVPERGDPRDALVSAAGLTLLDLPSRSRVGTGSPRRRAQLLAVRPDLDIVGIRGNVETRLAKLGSGEYEAVVLATAGLVRLGRDSVISQVLSPETMLPAAGQGALAVEVRADDGRTQEVVASANHAASWFAAVAERGFMARLGAGCHVPAAAYALLEGNDLWVRGLAGSHDGQTVIRGERRGLPEEAEALGRAVADDLLDRGARDLLTPGGEGAHAAD
ncbi:MAG: hydroxymethylbilane synthase, partial [Anaerolineae bacterium]